MSTSLSLTELKSIQKDMEEAQLKYYKAEPEKMTKAYEEYRKLRLAYYQECATFVTSLNEEN